MYEEPEYKDGALLINVIPLRCMRLYQSSPRAVCHRRAFCALPAEMPGLHAVAVGPLQNGEKDCRVWLFGQRPVLFVLGNTDQSDAGSIRHLVITTNCSFYRAEDFARKL